MKKKKIQIIDEELKNNIENKNVSVHVHRLGNNPAVFINISDTDLEMELGREYGFRIATRIVNISNFLLFASAFVLVTFEAHLHLQKYIFPILCLITLFSVVSIILRFLKRRMAPRMIRKAFEFDYDSIAFYSKINNKFVRDIRWVQYMELLNKSDKEEIMLFFTEHFCNNLTKTDISALIDKNISDPYNVFSLRSRILSQTERETLRSLEEDPRYLELVEEWKEKYSKRFMKFFEEMDEDD